MKILHITPSYKPAYIYGGPTISVSRLCETLVHHQQVCVVYTTTADGEKELKLPANEQVDVDGVKVYYFSRLTKDHTHFSPKLIWAVYKNVKSFDIVHIHSWWNLVAIFSTIICWTRGITPVLSPRGMLSNYSFSNLHAGIKGYIHRLFGKWLLSKTILHTTSQIELQRCLEIFPGWMHFIVPNIISIPNLNVATQKSSKSAAIQLIFLSRLDPKKGIEILFKALKSVDFDFNLKIYGNQGNQYQSSLEDLAHQLNITENIEWCGWVDGQSKFEILHNSDLLVLTSYNENFANVVLESLAVNTPVFLSNQVGLADYVEKNRFGWVCQLNENHIVQKLCEAYTAIKVQKLKFDHLQNSINIDFGESKLVSDYLQYYEQHRCK